MRSASFAATLALAAALTLAPVAAHAEEEESLAYIYAFVGISEAAVEIFDRLLATHYGSAITVEMLRLDPRLDILRDGPGFQAMLAKHE